MSSTSQSKVVLVLPTKKLAKNNFYCRFCLAIVQPKKLCNIFSKLDGYIEIAQIINKLTDITLSKHEPFSQVICAPCLEKVQNIYEFRNTIKGTDFKLKQKAFNHKRVYMNQHRSRGRSARYRFNKPPKPAAEAVIDLDDFDDNGCPLSQTNNNAIKTEYEDVEIEEVDMKSQVDCDNKKPLKCEVKEDLCVKTESEDLEMKEIYIKSEIETSDSEDAKSPIPDPNVFIINQPKEDLELEEVCIKTEVENRDLDAAPVPQSSDVEMKPKTEDPNIPDSIPDSKEINSESTRMSSVNIFQPLAKVNLSKTEQRELWVENCLELPCKKCGKRFIDLESLTSHARIHYEIIRCPVCSKIMMDAGDFEQHKLRHGFLICEYCDSLFKTPKSLKAHRQRHLIMRESLGAGKTNKMECKMCHLEFYSNVDLKAHFKKAHLGKIKKTYSKQMAHPSFV